MIIFIYSSNETYYQYVIVLLLNLESTLLSAT